MAGMRHRPRCLAGAGAPVVRFPGRQAEGHGAPVGAPSVPVRAGPHTLVRRVARPAKTRSPPGAPRRLSREAEASTLSPGSRFREASRCVAPAAFALSELLTDGSLCPTGEVPGRPGACLRGTRAGTAPPARPIRSPANGLRTSSEGLGAMRAGPRATTGSGRGGAVVGAAASRTIPLPEHLMKAPCLHGTLVQKHIWTPFE
ncbi:MAG: hypothetical protein OJF62_000860 [Pseudolabrys sp.]|jgi:hypothetical protein|nr:hypothetical protein [Pseudolabrys sp.]